MRGTYYAHLATLAFVALAIAFGAGSLFLLPSYFLARDHAAASERFRDAVAGTIDLKEANDIERGASRLNERLQIGNEFENAAVFEALISTLAEVSLRGITISGVSFVRRGEDAVVELAGVSGTREELLLFAEALKASGSFATVELPVSQLVSEKNIIFSVKTNFVKK